MNKLLICFVCYHYWQINGAVNAALAILILDAIIAARKTHAEGQNDDK